MQSVKNTDCLTILSTIYIYLNMNDATFCLNNCFKKWYRVLRF